MIKRVLTVLGLLVALSTLIVVVKKPQFLGSRAASQITGFQAVRKCQLTGKQNTNVTDIIGADTGISFIHKGKTYMFFGDINTHEAKPGKDMSNTLSYIEGYGDNDCPILHFISTRDVFGDIPTFYANESNTQALEEEKNKVDIDANIFNDFNKHKEWAKGKDMTTIMNELNRKFGKIIEYYHTKDLTKVADYYARTAVRLNKTGFAFRYDDNPSTYPSDYSDFQVHYNWVVNNKLDNATVLGGITYRTNKIINWIKQNRAKQAWPSKINPSEYTVIPTGAISLNNKIFVFYTSIKSWDSPGEWTANQSGLAYSEDDGKTFTRVDSLFAGNSNFAQINPVLNDNPLDKNVYLFGSIAGRSGNLKLARVDTEQITNRSAYRFCKRGTDPSSCTWVINESEASVIIDPPMGEFSIKKIDSLWYLIHRNKILSTLEVRTAKKITGPWTLFYKVPINTGCVDCYAAYFYPDVPEHSRIYNFNMTSWHEYNVSLYSLSPN